MTLETLNFWKPTVLRYTFVMLLFSILSGCKSHKSTIELDSVFNSKELKDIETLRLFFIEDIVNLDEEEFHLKFRDKMQKLEASGFATIKPKKIEKLFKSISESTFNEIWKTKIAEQRNRSYEYLAPNENGKYLKFLSKNTIHNSRIEAYYNKVKASGKFSHFSMLGYMADNTLDFDLKNPNIQIVMAIHYISICHDNNITSNLNN